MTLIPYNKRLLVSFEEEEKPSEQDALMQSFGVAKKAAELDALALLKVEAISEDLQYLCMKEKHVVVPRHMIESVTLGGEEFHLIEYRAVIAAVKK